MIIKRNLPIILGMITEKDRKRILASEKEFVVLELHSFNAGSYVTVKLTNNYQRYRGVFRRGDAVLYRAEIAEML